MPGHGAGAQERDLPSDLLDEALLDSFNDELCSGCNACPRKPQYINVVDLCPSCFANKYGVPESGAKRECLGDESVEDEGVIEQCGMEEIVKYIPMRLKHSERKILRMLEAALSVSEYSDVVDVIGGNRKQRIITQIREICSILAGLTVVSDYGRGQKIFQDREFSENQEFYQEVFEIGRRYKIMNPDKMRSTYGKLMYLLQDSNNKQINEILGFSLIKPIKTVHLTLKALNLLQMVNDPLIKTATFQIIPDGKSLSTTKKEVSLKESSVKQLLKKYTSNMSQEDVEMAQLCIYSISDYYAFLNENVRPCEQMIGYLKEHFDPRKPQEGFSLSIKSGYKGARLTHDHEKQYYYVFQSLALWKEVLTDMYKLWFSADADMLDGNNEYRILNTGQGLNRVQFAPETSNNIRAVLYRARSQVGTWVGSTVIHLGDNNVPNALMFIDKYSQVYRLLCPVINVIKYVREALWKSSELNGYFDSLGGPENVCKNILLDFFRQAFDGSGANNFYDAGSCIDGRLTSAWNWCSTINKKTFYPIFLLSGFIGFDGDWV